MTEVRTNKWRWRVAGLILGFAAVWGIYVKTKPADEVVLTIGEPYTQIRQQSRSTLPVLTSDNRINLYVRRTAVLRFSDPQYGFVTSPAEFLSLYSDQDGKVTQLTLSPQVETLPLDEAMAIAVALQDQLRRAHWRPILTADHPPITEHPPCAPRYAPEPTHRLSGWLATNIRSLSIFVASNTRTARTTSGT
jgi:hypothetical protein